MDLLTTNGLPGRSRCLLFLRLHESTAEFLKFEDTLENSEERSTCETKSRTVAIGEMVSPPSCEEIFIEIAFIDDPEDD